MTNRDETGPTAPRTPDQEAEAQRLNARIVELTARREAAERGGVSCSNPRHPDGPYHVATPLPGSWEWPERLAQRLRRKAWGCGCRPRLGDATLLTLGNRLAITTAIQAGGSPRIDLAGTSAQIDGDDTEGVTWSYRGVMVRRPAKGDRGNRPNPVATPTRGVLIATHHDGAGWPWWSRVATTRAADLSTVVNRVIHNVAAHPLLELCPPLGGWLHDRTAGQAFPDLDAIHGDAGWGTEAWDHAASIDDQFVGELTEAMAEPIADTGPRAEWYHAATLGDIIASEDGRAALDAIVVVHGYHEHTLPDGYSEEATTAYRRFMALHHGHDRLVDTDPLRLTCRTCHGSALTLTGPPVGAEATEDLGADIALPESWGRDPRAEAVDALEFALGGLLHDDADLTDPVRPGYRVATRLQGAGWDLLRRCPECEGTGEWVVQTAVDDYDRGPCEACAGTGYADLTIAYEGRPYAGRPPTLGGTVEGTGYWTVDDVPLPDGVPHELAKGAPRIALRDPEGRSWATWARLTPTDTLRAQLDAGAKAIADQRSRTIADDVARVRFGPTFPDFLAEAMTNAAAEATTALHARLAELGLDPADYTVVWDTDPVQGAPLNLLTVGATAIPKDPAPWPPAGEAEVAPRPIVDRPQA